MTEQQTPQNDEVVAQSSTTSTHEVGVQQGSFRAKGSGDTSGFGGLVVRKLVPAVTTRPFGGYFDEVATVISGGTASTLALHGSTEEEQF